jgi:hypothetical protein
MMRSGERLFMATKGQLDIASDFATVMPSGKSEWQMPASGLKSHDFIKHNRHREGRILSLAINEVAFKGHCHQLFAVLAFSLEGGLNLKEHSQSDN